jgi:hypothetical protein
MAGIPSAKTASENAVLLARHSVKKGKGDPVDGYALSTFSPEA